MINEVHFHLNDHPVIAFIIMLGCLTGSVLLNFTDVAKDLVPFAQIAACAMTLVVGYKTLKKLDKK